MVSAGDPTAEEKLANHKSKKNDEIGYDIPVPIPQYLTTMAQHPNKTENKRKSVKSEESRWKKWEKK